MFWSFLHAGQVQHLETMMAPIGGIGHFILIIVCLTAHFHQTTDTKEGLAGGKRGILLHCFFSIT